MTNNHADSINYISINHIPLYKHKTDQETYPTNQQTYQQLYRTPNDSVHKIVVLFYMPLTTIGIYRGKTMPKTSHDWEWLKSQLQKW